MRYLLISIVILAGLFFTNTAYSQKIAVKSNLLYDATGTINIGGEFGLSKKTTLDLSVNLNLWKPSISRNKRLNHILVQPEFRYWLCKPFNGHFFGAHAHYAFYNVGGDNWLLDSFKTISSRSKSDLSNFHYRGWLLGAGLSYGYHWILHKRWSLEGTIGFGYAYLDYDKYSNPVCGAKVESNTTHYFGPTKVGITLVFMIK